MQKTTLDSSHHDHAHPPYIAIWAVLLVLLFVSIALGHISNAYLMTSLVFGVAAIKAVIVLRYFMHLKFEPLYIVLMILAAVLCLVVLFIGVYPDVSLRTGWLR